jgi:hypothetical protein
MIPIRLGYEYAVTNDFGEPIFRVTLSYEHNLVFGEGLDGYNDPSSHFKNNNLDQYRQITIGVKFNFGSNGVF